MASIVAGLITTGCSVFGIRTTHEPSYTVERAVGPVEIRRYGARLAAETVVAGGEYEARNVGFRRLAGYIFGANSGKVTIDMTAPVAQASAASGRSIDMTAPVDQARTGDGWRIRFFMPPEFTLQTLPIPNDKTVSLATVPPERVAVLRYAGVASSGTARREQDSLVRTLAAAGVATEGVPFSWFYDPPWTIPPLRRNEAVIRLPPGQDTP